MNEQQEHVEMTQDVSLTAIDVPPPAQRGTALRPVGEGERLASLDVLRGVALLGIFMVNMQLFAMPFMQAMFDVSLLDAPLRDRLATAFVKAFCEYKFISLFSLLFGAGFVMQLMRARRARGSDWAFVPVYLRRAGVLFLFGFVHAFGLWYGDILLIYATLGLLLLPFARLEPRILLIIAGVFLAVGILLSTAIGAIQVVAFQFTATDVQEAYAEAERMVAAGEAPTGFDAIRQSNGDPNHPYWRHGESTAYKEGPFLDAVLYRAVLYAYMLMAGIFSFLWHVLAMFLVGAAMMKADFFAPSRRAWHLKLALFALPFGLLLELANVVQWWVGGHELSMGLVAMVPVHELGSVLLCLGFVGLWCVIVDNGWLRPVTTALANVGRMALTNYLMQTVIATFIMYWWGLGMFGEVSRSAQVGLVLAIYAGQVVFSAVWMRFFRIGPLEWLWRTLTYLRPQPLLRRSSTLSDAGSTA